MRNGYPHGYKYRYEADIYSAGRIVGSPTSTRDKVNSQYISEVQASPYKLVLWG